MGRQIRRVPPDWQHPKDENGNHIPLHNGPVERRIAEWDKEAQQWANGFKSDYEGGWEPRGDSGKGMTYAQWAGERPDPEDYMPTWPDDVATHIAMYENTSEGTPISPTFGTPEPLARWLADNGASAFGSCTATYEQWLATCPRGWAVSAVYTPEAGLVSGVEGLASDP